MRSIYIILIVSLLLSARDNPFVPSNTQNLPQITSNTNEQKKPLTSAEITLPNEARVLQKVTLEYQNLDGSIATKNIDIDKAIDWHQSIILQQAKQKSTKIDENGTKNSQVQISSFIEAGKNLPKFKIEQKKIYIYTNDKPLRDFLLTSPQRVVIDFDCQNEVAYKHLNIGGIVNSIKIGNHDKYYRVVIELDGKYKYSLTKNQDYYLITLN